MAEITLQWRVLGCVACSDKVCIYFVVCNDTNSVLLKFGEIDVHNKECGAARLDIF